MLEEGVVEVLTTKVSITSSSLDSKDTTGDVEQRDIESSSTQIENQDVLLRFGLLVETVSDGGSSGFVDDAEDFEASDGAGILGGKAL